MRDFRFVSALQLVFLLMMAPLDGALAQVVDIGTLGLNKTTIASGGQTVNNFGGQTGLTATVTTTSGFTGGQESDFNFGGDLVMRADPHPTNTVNITFTFSEVINGSIARIDFFGDSGLHETAAITVSGIIIDDSGVGSAIASGFSYDSADRNGSNQISPLISYYNATSITITFGCPAASTCGSVFVDWDISSVGEVNLPPTASSVAYTGTPADGQQLSGTYAYGDLDGDLEEGSTFRWVRNNVNTGVVGGSGVGTAQSYTVATADRNNYLYFCVTPVAATGTSPGSEVCSSAIQVQNDAPVASSVSYTGTPAVGRTLSGTYSYSDADGNLEEGSTFRWVRNNVDTGVAGGTDVGTAQNYTVAVADRNNYLYFCVTPVAVTGTSPGTEVCSAAITVSNEAELSVTKTDGVTSAAPGESLTYTIVVSNAGPSDVASASLTDTLPAVLTCTFTSVADGGASGNTASGSGDIDETLSLPNGSSVTYTVNCDIAAAASGTLSNTASVSSDFTDPSPGNDSATDDDTELDDRDGVTEETENGVPDMIGSGNGDGNGDGTPDGSQLDVSSLPTAVGGGYVTLDATADGGIQLSNVQALAAPVDPPPGLNFPYGIFSFRATGVVETLHMSVFVPSNANITGYWKKGNDGKWYNLATNIVLVGNKTRLDFSIADNGNFDTNPAVGVVDDPSGPTGVNAIIPTMSEWLQMLLAAMLVVMAAFRLRYRVRG